MSYDRKCYDLAEAFLEDQPISHDHTKRIGLLAQHIQTSIEDWFEMNPDGPSVSYQLSKRQRKLDASVTPEQARVDVRREREALTNRDKPHPQPDGFINDYD